MGLSKDACCLFLAVLMVVLLPESSCGNNPRYEKFLNQHRDEPRSRFHGRYCNTIMGSRGLTKPECKEVNTFIHGSKRQIRAVCAEGGLPSGELRRSRQHFRVTTCTLRGGSTRPPCEYKENISPSLQDPSMLVSKVSWSLLAHLAILLGFLMVQSCEGQSRVDFERKHIDYPKSYPTSHPDTYCNQMMLQKGLTRYVCKDINTFINDFPVNVVQVCRGKGTPHGSDTDSKDSFDMIICRYTGGPAPNGCRYSGTSAHLRIRVTCTGIYPTHYVTQMR